MKSDTFDFQHPNYTPVFAARLDRLAKMRADPQLMAACRVHYANNPADFINDWGVTLDPRNIDRGLPAMVPFVLFDRQREWIEYAMRKWMAREPGLTEKSRDMGVSWLAVALGATLCMFRNDFVAGYGSRKEEYVDRADSPKSLFYKARVFVRHVPPEFRAGWNERKHAPHMRVSFPATNSVMTGEAGDGIGRGDRTSIYFVDEAAHLERPRLVDASLSATTNARHDISSVNGRDNPFAEKRFGGFVEPFIMDWRDDPRKNQAWYDRQVLMLTPAVVAQEIDRNYDASKENIIIPNEWVQAAVGACAKLGIVPSGKRYGALDVADEGVDKNAFGAKLGVELFALEEWSGKGSDIFGTVARAFNLCDDHRLDGFDYDSDGLGSGVRGDARVLNETRTPVQQIEATAFRGSGKVIAPDAPIPTAFNLDRDGKERTNDDFFANRKAQAWWSLRVRFQRTYRAVVEGMPFDPDEIISISPTLPDLAKLTSELSQPTYDLNGAGKVLVDKAPAGSKSPNLGDAVMILYAPQEPVRIGFF